MDEIKARNAAYQREWYHKNRARALSYKQTEKARQRIREAHRRRRKSVWQGATFVCPWCGVSFNRVGKPECCSEECRRSRQRARSRQWRALRIVNGVQRRRYARKPLTQAQREHKRAYGAFYRSTYPDRRRRNYQHYKARNIISIRAREKRRRERFGEELKRYKVEWRRRNIERTRSRRRWDSDCARLAVWKSQVKKMFGGTVPPELMEMLMLARQARVKLREQTTADQTLAFHDGKTWRR